MAKILIVDDNPNILKTLKVCLEANGFEVSTAASGTGGMIKVKGERPDLIILDVIMCDKDGYSFVKEIKSGQEMKDIPIIVVSAQDDYKVLFETKGITDYLLKPVDPKELVRKINKCLKDPKEGKTQRKGE